MIARRSIRTCWLLPVLAMVGLASCASAPTTKKTPAGSLKLDVEPAEALVYLNDSLIGRAADLKRAIIPVSSAEARVQVSADGYFSEYRLIQVGPAELAVAQVKLHRVPAGESP